jgi:hypothetical protein
MRHGSGDVRLASSAAGAGSGHALNKSCSNAMPSGSSTATTSAWPQPGSCAAMESGVDPRTNAVASAASIR